MLTIPISIHISIYQQFLNFKLSQRLIGLPKWFSQSKIMLLSEVQNGLRLALEIRSLDASDSNEINGVNSENFSEHQKLKFIQMESKECCFMPLSTLFQFFHGDS